MVFCLAERSILRRLSYLSSISFAVYPVVMHPLSDPFIKLGALDVTEVIERAERFF